MASGTRQPLNIIHRLTIFKPRPKNLDEANNKQVNQYNLCRRLFELSVGDLVSNKDNILSNKEVKIASKLKKDCEGPFKIIAKLSPTVYELSKITGKSIGK